MENKKLTDRDSIELARQLEYGIMASEIIGTTYIQYVVIPDGRMFELDREEFNKSDMVAFKVRSGEWYDVILENDHNYVIKTDDIHMSRYNKSDNRYMLINKMQLDDIIEKINKIDREIELKKIEIKHLIIEKEKALTGV